MIVALVLEVRFLLFTFFMLCSILFIFLLNFFIIIFFNQFLNNFMVKIISIIFLIYGLYWSFSLLKIFLIDSNIIYILDLGVWLEFDNLKIKWEFLFDSMNIFMIITVMIISSLVHIYSFDYMKNDPHFGRFISYLSLFTFFMIILLTANNFIIMFIGWEGVGLCSYLLINFWYTRIQANKAAIKAMIINKIGDFGMLVGMLLIFNNFETFNYHTIFLSNFFNNLNIDLICFFLFIGCMGKSAQIGLHMWLPDAMEGPTPVSALIHAATMVTAGVFLIIRCSFLFEFSTITLNIISLIGLLTAIFGATVGLFQYDIKKIIAYSTCSQLGLMFCACGLSAYSLSLFHLVNHAFFKALLFLCAGSIIHGLSDEQDIRKMGGLGYLLPLTYVSLFIASLSLIGFPFLSGYYSKELLIYLIYFNNFEFNLLKFYIVYITSVITVMYSLKILINVFLFKSNGLERKYLKVIEVSFFIIFVYFILVFFSLFSGILLKDLLIGNGSLFLNNGIFYLSKNYNIQYLEFIPNFVKLQVICIPLVGVFFFFKFNNIFNFINITKLKIFFIYFFNKKYFFDKIINLFSLNIIKISYLIFYKCIDKGFIENSIFNILNCINKYSTLLIYYNNFNLFTYLYIVYSLFFFFIFIIIGCIYFKFFIIIFFLFLFLYNLCF